MNGAHIAVVDDEADLRSAVARYLGRNGFTVSEASNGAGLRALMAQRAVDLVLLDVNMPGEDGFSVARFLRSQGPVGIIMLTGVTDPIDRVAGLELGADDYVAKPFDLRELLARVRAVLRRAERPEAPTAVPAAVPAHVLRIGRCMFHLQDRRLFALDGRELALTAREADLLHLFACRPGSVLSRDDILDLDGEPEAEPFSRAIDARVARLRRKVEIDPARPRAIRTVHGQGYMFVPSA